MMSYISYDSYIFVIAYIYIICQLVLDKDDIPHFHVLANAANLLFVVSCVCYGMNLNHTETGAKGWYVLIID